LYVLLFIFAHEFPASLQIFHVDQGIIIGAAAYPGVENEKL